MKKQFMLAFVSYFMLTQDLKIICSCDKEGKKAVASVVAMLEMVE